MDQGKSAQQSSLYDAAKFVQQVQLRDPLMYPHKISHKPLRVREAINAWGPIPAHDHSFQCSQVEVHTDGSALLSNERPAVPVNAAVFGIMPARHKLCLGAV